MKKHIAIAVLSGLAMLATAGNAVAQVAGSTTLSVTVEEMKNVAHGWSAKKTILGHDIYNDNKEKIGTVEDIIIAPNKTVSYVIVEVGSFLGMGGHYVAIPIGHFKEEGNKLILPGATKEVLKGLPKFEYAPSKTTQ
jgi:sporulation protein YlmC with PRC-barrel domain